MALMRIKIIDASLIKKTYHLEIINEMKIWQAIGKPYGSNMDL